MPKLVGMLIRNKPRSSPPSRTLCSASPDTDVEELAAFFEAILRGMAVKARDGVSVDRLVMIGRAAMRAWPTAAGDEVRE
jgi:hypothetical protein